MDILTAAILLILGVLQVILFFKIWGMTNDVREIRNKYLTNNMESDAILEKWGEDQKFKVNDHVVSIKSGTQMRVKSITPNGKYACYINNGITHLGDFSAEELKLFGE